MLKYVFGGAAILAASTAIMFVLFWQEPPSRWDTNQDQMLSLHEFRAAWSSLVRIIDLNSNGRITRHESQEFLRQNDNTATKNLAMASFFNRMDANGNNVLEYNEVADNGAITAYFDIIDQNNSGAIEFSETWRRPIGKFLFGKE